MALKEATGKQEVQSRLNPEPVSAWSQLDERKQGRRGSDRYIQSRCVEARACCQ